ncbi:unnamed protein product [Microthlaspi erraticum]|uniref:RRM domain-containing protein n=1 Tax=Microthlaspi erraticum TaxID=1685480 RepID=A0A6D2J8C1_9BRAS|nr:unnamed protein product [Microthlaspi erraticum]
MAHRDHESDDPIISDSSLNPGVAMTRDGVENESDTTLRSLTPQRHLRNMLFPNRHDRMAARKIENHRHELMRAELLEKASMDTLEPPEEKRIKTLLVRELNPRICEQDIRVLFGAYGQIESIRFLAEEGRAFVTYTSLEGSEKAKQDLSKWLGANGMRLKLMWAGPEFTVSCTSENNRASSSSSYQMLPRQP